MLNNVFPNFNNHVTLQSRKHWSYWAGVLQLRSVSQAIILWFLWWSWLWVRQSRSALWSLTGHCLHGMSQRTQKVSSNQLQKEMQNHTGRICLTFLQCVFSFSNKCSNGLDISRVAWVSGHGRWWSSCVSDGQRWRKHQTFVKLSQIQIHIQIQIQTRKVLAQRWRKHQAFVSLFTSPLCYTNVTLMSQWWRTQTDYIVINAKTNMEEVLLRLSSEVEKAFVRTQTSSLAHCAVKHKRISLSMKEEEKLHVCMLFSEGK